MLHTRTCQHCNAPLSPFARADSLYCSGRCRTAACRALHSNHNPIPLDLRDRDRWVRRDATKRPLTVDGYGASSTNARTWATYAAASSASTVGNGLGFVLDGCDNIACIDIDHCIEDDGGLAPWAATIIEQLPRTYTEVSPSGRGLHAWGFARLPHGRVVHVDGGKVELYGGPGRYITITGQPFAGAPSHLADLSGVIAQVLGT